MCRGCVVVVFVVAVLAACCSAEPTARVVGGSESGIAAHPYQASVRFKNCSTCAYVHRCGAVIFSQRILVSSANCVSGVSVKSLLVVVGSNSIYQTEGVIIPVESYIVHEDYESLYIDNDISVIKLALDVPFDGKTMAPIELAKKLPGSGSTGYVTGWGSVKEAGAFSEKLKVAKVRLVSDADCKASYGASRITGSMICAGVTAGQADSCKGDSGGPLVVGEELVGIVSWGRGCGRAGFPGVYANVVALREWIEAKAAQLLISRG